MNLLLQSVLSDNKEREINDINLIFMLTESLSDKFVTV